MFVTLEDEMAETMSFASSTNAVAVILERSVQQCLFIVDFFKNVTVVELQQISHKYFNTNYHRKVP
jgi:hypothetical protein